jgi:phosphoribosyl-AMP cyclohydrolase
MSDPKVDLPVRYDDRGLVPAIAQQYDTGEVLMMAWMNADALRETLATGNVCYWSRSRSAPWRKGETSGNVQRLVDCRLDCDGDVVLLQVDQSGPACHTGQRTCFFRPIDPDRFAGADTDLNDCHSP